MRWALLGISVGSFAMLWGVAPGYGLLIAFLVMFGNFATFCILYDRPVNTARQRVAQQLLRLHPNTDAAQRLAAARITPSAADRRLGFGPMPMLNLVTGLAALVLLFWGISLRLF